MRREVILLVAGLAVAAALPVQEQVPSSPHSDLLKVILSANPEENDLKTTPDEKPSVAPTKMEDQVTQTEMVKQQPLPQPQDPPQSLSQDSPQEQPQPQDTPQEQPQPQDTPQEQPQAQDTPHEHPQVQDIPQEQLQPQNPTIDPEEPSLPYVSEGEVPSEHPKFSSTLWPVSQATLMSIKMEGLPLKPKEPERDELNSDLEMGGFLAESDDGYVVLQANEEPPSLDTEGTFMYRLRMTPLPFNQEGEPFISDPEEEYDSDRDVVSFEPQMDSLPFEPEDPQMKPFLVESQEDSLPYDSGANLDPNPQMDSFSLDEQPLESDYEQLSQEMDDRHFRPDDYYYDFSMEEDQPGLEEDNMPSAPESAPVEQSYHESQGDTAIDLFSWLVPDFFDDKSTDYDESPYITSYHDDMIDEDPFANKPEMQFESQVLDQTANWEEPFASEGFDGAVQSHDSSLEDEDGTVLVSETVLPDEEEDGDVSLADFFIPIYDAPAFANIPQEYPGTGNLEGSSEELVSLDEEHYPVDDGLFHAEPELKPYQVDEEQNQLDMEMFGDNILFPENPSFEDEGYIFPWPTEGDEEEETEYPEEDTPLTILESQPTYLSDVETDVPYPSLQDRMLEGFAGDEVVEPWNDAKSFMVDLKSDSDAEDDEILPIERDYSSSSLDNDAMDIIVLKDPRENFDDFPIRPLVDDITRRYPIPIVRYTEDQRSRPYWVPQRVPDQQFPKKYFSATDERPRRKIPSFFDRMDEDTYLSPPPSRRSLKTPVMRNPFTFLNEIMDDDLSPQYLASPSTSRQFRVMDPDTLTSPRNYPDAFKSPKFSFRDLLQRLSPSFYDDTHISNMAKQSSPQYYPQSYNSMQHYDDLPQQYLHTSPPSPPVPYSSPFDSFQERAYSPVQNYYTNRPQTSSFFSSNNDPSSLFREDTMPEMYSRQPRRHFDDYTVDLPFMSSDSFSSPRPRFPFFQRPQYSANSPAYKRPYYSQNSFYGIGPYYPKPIYPRYTPVYY